MKQYIIDALEELKRVDHLIYVSLKYTRTVDVLKNTIGRMLNCFECIINGVLAEAEEDKKIFEVPAAPLKKCEEMKKLYGNDKELMEFIDLYLQLRKINRAEYGKESEYRRHVTLIAHLEDGRDKKIDIDIITEYYKKCKDFLEHVKGKFDKND